MSELFDYKQATDKWQQAQEQHRQTVKEVATSTSKILRARGIKQVKFGYCGSGDEGCIEDCDWKGEGTISQEERESLEDLVYELLPSGWELNEGSEGTVVFNLETGEVLLSHSWLEYVEVLTERQNSLKSLVSKECSDLW